MPVDDGFARLHDVLLEEYRKFMETVEASCRAARQATEPQCRDRLVLFWDPIPALHTLPKPRLDENWTLRFPWPGLACQLPEDYYA